jgi:hypothetical protein
MKPIQDRMLDLDHLIHQKCTGTLAECAKKMGVSNRSVYKYLRVLRSFGAWIEFSRDLNTYYYGKEGRFVIQLSRKVDIKGTPVIQIAALEFHFALTIIPGKTKPAFGEMTAL